MDVVIPWLPEPELITTGRLQQMCIRDRICSPGELQICRQLGLPAEKFVISGVYKEPELMGKLISEENGFGIYTAVSYTHLDVYKRQPLSGGT